MEDYSDELTGDDLEDLLSYVERPNSIMRDFFEEGQISEQLAEEYGILIANTPIDGGLRFKFPEKTVVNAPRLEADIKCRFAISPRIFSKEITRSVRGWQDQGGTFHELDSSVGRNEQLKNYQAEEDTSFCFCQMCQRPKGKQYIEVDCIRREPGRYMAEGYLSLCLECGKKFRELRDMRHSIFANSLRQEILNTPLGNSGTVTINM